mmetsp:Transcript_26766/g.44224  ORF Transcript_26766/g.44224 Transcript_26766/m.44224 type:complete len:536 (-) Transcript_26766:95-1702(-)|eukprot:scaffold320_cov149-Skeletonema_menzelii.AAC.1
MTTSEEECKADDHKGRRSECQGGAAAAAAATSGGRQRHILFIGASQKSHIIHMQGLAEEMARRGHKVTFAALESDRNVVTSTNSGQKVEFLSAGEPEHDAAYYGYTHDIVDLFRLCADYSLHLHQALLPVLKQQQDPIDLVVFDHLFWPAGDAISRDMNARGVQLYPGLFGLEHLGMEPDYGPMIISGFQTSDLIGSKNIPNRLKNFIMLRVARNILQTVRYFIFKPVLKELNISSSNPYGQTKLALHGSFGGLAEVSRSQHTLSSPLVQSTGPWLPRTTSLSKEVDKFLNSADGPPTVFVSIGTNANWNSEMSNVMVETIMELQKLKQLKVLWSIKDKDFQEFVSPVMKNASTSVEELSDTLLVVPFVDQLAVLESDKVVVFVTHCGFGSMQEAIHTRTPVLAMPMMLESDQVTNAARLVELGVAEPFDSRPGEDVISSEEMLKKLLALANEKSYHEKATKLSLASNMLEGPRRAAEWLEIEMETGTDVFMVGIENHLSWIERNSLDCYLILSLVAFVLYKAASKLRSRKHKIR